MIVYDLIKLVDNNHYVWIVDGSDDCTLYFEGARGDIPISLLNSRITSVYAVKSHGLHIGIEYKGD